MDSLARRLFFQSAIKKNWIPLWVRWGVQAGQLTGCQGLVQCLVLTSTLLIMPTVTATHSHALAGTTLLLLQCRTRSQSWPGLGPSHLMRWRYFILTLLNKYKKNHFIIYGQKTCNYINILTTFKKMYFPMHISRQRRKSLFLSFLDLNLLNTRQEYSSCQEPIIDGLLFLLTFLIFFFALFYF